MSDDRKDMTTTAACQLVDLLYASVSACQQMGDKLAAVEAERDQLAAKLAEVEQANAEWSAKYDDSIRKYKALKEANSLWIQQSEGLRKQLAAANQRIADLTAPVVGDYHCGPA